jgi:hypothetical protein
VHRHAHRPTCASCCGNRVFPSGNVRNFRTPRSDSFPAGSVDQVELENGAIVASGRPA